MNSNAHEMLYSHNWREINKYVLIMPIMGLFENGVMPFKMRNYISDDDEFEFKGTSTDQDLYLIGFPKHTVSLSAYQRYYVKGALMERAFKKWIL